ncbi:MAG: DNA polymerase I [Phycisphaerales bacterium]|nr:DNA polymerase I [Phycisphaerales bacterium]MCB9854802.1 DNA polymerase I [Phycisphaerales bacterium]MCB9863726.1 DNA polymerase I [Phycisphaerales bacterium]
MASKSLYLVDGHAQIYRAYYAPFGNLTSPSGEPTRAVHVFTQMLLNLLRDRKPDYLAMAMDVSDRTVFRVDIDAEYKATRDKSPEDLGPQIDRIVEIVTAMNIPILRLEGFEADDLMATLARRHASPDLDVYLVSRDKDLDQLLTDHVRMYDPGKDVVIDQDMMRAEKGFGPEKAIEAQMLMGDSTDNIKGANGVGPKKAAQLLEKYGSVDDIIAHADELTPKLRENILEFANRKDIVRQLVTLKTDVDFPFSLDDARIDQFDINAAMPILRDLGLKRLVERVASDATPTEESRETKRESKQAKPPAQGMLFGDPDTPVDSNHLPDGLTGYAPDKVDYRLIATERELINLCTTLARQHAFAFDTETTGLNPASADLCGISIAWEPATAYYIPVRGVGATLDEAVVLKHLGPIFADERIAKCGQNIKYDIVMLESAGYRIRNIDFDTMIASFVLEPARRSHGIDGLSRELLQYEKIPTQDLIGKGKSMITFDKIETDRTCVYACEDADIAWRLREILAKQIESAETRSLYENIELPLVEVLAAMELRGVALDLDVLAELSGTMTKRLDELETEIHDAAGRPFNINSTKQLGEILFDEMGLRVVRRTRTTRSTDAEVLETLANETEHPLPRLVLEHRELTKLKGTYVDALPALVNPRTNRVHPSFHQTGAITGRLSCSDPNLQNIPIRTELGAQIRRAFVPGDSDFVLIKADYSQIELRILAHFSGDEELGRAFAEDRDIHAYVAAQLADVPIEAVTKEQRARAKTVNFGIVYGQSAFGLSRQTGMPMSEAKDFIEAYFARYPKIRGFLDSCIEHARKHEYVKTLLGRRRDIPEINSRNQTARNQAERLAANTVIQGTAADLIKQAMINIHRRVERENRPSRMLIQVHDELVFETPKDAAKHEAAFITKEMSEAIPLSVPIKVDVSIGANWLEAERV